MAVEEEELDPEPVPVKVDQVLEADQKGTIDELKEVAVDPSDTIQDEDDPRAGLPRFLSWEHKKDQNGDEILTAYTKDNKKITLVVDEPPPPPKQYKVVIEEVEPQVIEEPVEKPVNPKHSS